MPKKIYHYFEDCPDYRIEESYETLEQCKRGNSGPLRIQKREVDSESVLMWLSWFFTGKVPGCCKEGDS